MATFIKIASVTVGAGGASSIDFTSIPSTYTDLQILLSGRCTKSTGDVDDLYIKFNTASTSFSYRGLYGNGSTAGSHNGTSNYCGAINSNNTTSNTFTNTSIYIPNYAGSTNKSLSTDIASENNATAARAEFDAVLWSNTAAINAVSLYFTSGSNWVQYSSATLYGISKS